MAKIGPWSIAAASVSLAVALSAFLPWASFFGLSITGIDDAWNSSDLDFPPGWATLPLGLVAGILAIIPTMATRIASTLPAVATTVLAILALVNLQGADPGIGVIITLAGGVVAAAFAIVAAVRERHKGPVVIGDIATTPQ